MSNDQHYTIIKSPVISEKSMTGMHSNNEYQFIVDKRATKLDIKKAVEQLFRVKVDSVNTSVSHGKAKQTRFGKSKRSDVKKAFVTLSEGQTIEIVGGVE
jgi:large subunit ribosomal protein L23